MNLYGKLTFNGYTFQNYEIVSVGNSEANLFATNRTMTLEDGATKSTFSGFEYENPTFTFDLMKVDKNRNPLKFSRDEIFNLQRRLYSKQEVGVLQIKEKDNVIFYGAFVGKPTETYLGNVQYLSLEFQTISNCCYSPIINQTSKVVVSKTLEIYNESNASERIIPDIEIEMIEGNDIEIFNATTGEKITINGMENLENIYVYGNTSEFISRVDKSRNIFKLSSKKVLSLIYGKNIIKISANKAKVRFIYQYEVLIY